MGGRGGQCSMPPSIFSFDYTMTNTERESEDGGRGAVEKTVNGFIHPVVHAVSHQDYQTL